MKMKIITHIILFSLTLALFVSAPTVDGSSLSSQNFRDKTDDQSSLAEQPLKIQADSASVRQLFQTPSLFARILQQPPIGHSTTAIASNSSSLRSINDVNGTRVNNKENEVDSGDDDDDEEDDEEDEDNEDEEDDEEGEDEEVEADAKSIEKFINKPDGKTLTDAFGHPIKMEANRTQLLKQTKARDLGLLTLKALILGPLIGLTIKAALIRGIFYAIAAYALHLFVPGLLGTLGLGTGLVGFARQLQPNYAQMLLPHLANIPHALPTSFTRLAGQYQQVISPVVDSIRAIPEGHCRFRAVCETGSQLIKNARSMSSSLQRISATVYMNFGSDYAKAWLDGIVQSDCALKYSQCPSSPFSLVAAKLAQALGARQSIMLATTASTLSGSAVPATAGVAANSAADSVVQSIGEK